MHSKKLIKKPSLTHTNGDSKTQAITRMMNRKLMMRKYE